jgi:hypothetical protein
MEILKFDESGPSSPSRKPLGRGAILVTFVALVFGAGTALASGTLTVNGDNTIALDQGVANSVQCDRAIDVSLKTAYVPNSSDFVFKGVDVSGISVECDGKYFTIHTYDDEGSEQVFCNAYVPAVGDGSASGDLGCAADGKSAKLLVSGATLSYAFTYNLVTGTPTRVNVGTVTVESTDI